MHFATGRRLVSADWQQGNVDFVTVADFLEAGKISTVAAMKNGAPVHRDDEAAKGAMQIGQKSRAPVMARCKRDFQRAELHRLPVIELVHDMETKIVHQISHAHRHNDRLIGRDVPQRPPVEMIEMRVRHQDEINRREMMNLETWLLEPLDHLQPLRPIRIDQDVDLVGLN